MEMKGKVTPTSFLEVERERTLIGVGEWRQKESKKN